MEVNKIVYFSCGQAPFWCRYYSAWHKIPVYITEASGDSRSALYKDGSGFIILSAGLLQESRHDLINNRLWHEVAHLYYKDVWAPWDIGFEFRADLVASAATSRSITLQRLYAIKALCYDTNTLELLDKRIKNLYAAPNSYSKFSALRMLTQLRPVTVLS